MNSNGFPLIFKAVKGECEKSLEDSWFNMDEVRTVYDTIKQLLPPIASNNRLRSITQKDIGVVTPYRFVTILIFELKKEFFFILIDNL